jgi:ferrochelatase
MRDDTIPKTCPMHAPDDHPKLPKPKVGVLLSNLGTPDDTDYWSMRRYLGEFLSDRRVIDYSPWLWQPLLQLIILTKRPFTSGAAYRTIWNEEANESPLLTITKQQNAAITETMKALYGDDVLVDYCMRYGNPSTKSKVRAMVEAGCTKILFVPLYPHYAGATSATANDQFFRALMEEKWQPTTRTIEPYFEHPLYIEALAQSVERAYAAAEKKPDILVCSYHGVPKRYLMEGDPYHWLQPYTVKEVARLAEEDGKKNIAVIAPAFSSDCIETLEEINEEIKESFEEGGGEHFTYIPCLNDDPAHITALSAVIEENLKGWLD